MIMGYLKIFFTFIGRIFIVFSCLIALWHILVVSLDAPHYIFPSPYAVFQAFITHHALLIHHASITMLEVFFGLLFGGILGFLSGLSLLQFYAARRLLLPVMLLSQAIPVFALAPLLTLWLGYGLASKIAMTILVIYFPVTISFYDGLRRTPQNMLDLAHVMNATPFRILWYLRVRHAVPQLASGFKLAASFAPIGAIIGEWVGASKGLGYLMLYANGRLKIDLMFAAIFILAGLAVSLHSLVGKVGDYVSHTPINNEG